METAYQIEHFLKENGIKKDRMEINEIIKEAIEADFGSKTSYVSYVMRRIAMDGEGKNGILINFPEVFWRDIRASAINKETLFALTKMMRLYYDPISGVNYEIGITTKFVQQNEIKTIVDKEKKDLIAVFGKTYVKEKEIKLIFSFEKTIKEIDKDLNKKKSSILNNKEKTVIEKKISKELKKIIEEDYMKRRVDRMFN